MKNPNNLKAFAVASFGSLTVAKGLNGEGDGTVQSPPFVPYGEGTGYFPTGGKGAFSTTIQVIDIKGDPLVSAHVKWKEGGTTAGTITDANGEATINVSSETTKITITYQGKRTHVAMFKDLVNAMITLQENVTGLPPVTVGTKPPVANAPLPAADKNKKMLTHIAIGVGAIFLIAALSSKGKTGKAGKAAGLNAPKSKKKKKGKKGKKRKGLREPAPQITL